MTLAQTALAGFVIGTVIGVVIIGTILIAQWFYKRSL